MKVEWNGTPDSDQRRRGHRPKGRVDRREARAESDSQAEPELQAIAHASGDATVSAELLKSQVEVQGETPTADGSSDALTEPKRSTAKSRRAARRAKRQRKKPTKHRRFDVAHEEPNEVAADEPREVLSTEPVEVAAAPVMDDADPAEQTAEEAVASIPVATIARRRGKHVVHMRATVTPENQLGAERVDEDSLDADLSEVEAAADIDAASEAERKVAGQSEAETEPETIAKDEVIAEFHAEVEAAKPKAIPPSKWRVRLVVVAVLSVWIVLICRLVFLQAISQPDLSARARNQRLYVEEVQARPGDIVDRHGRLLATTVKSRSLFVDPKRITEHWQFAIDVAEPLGINRDVLFERLMKNRTKRFLWIKRRLSEDEAEVIEHLGLPEGTWGFRVEYLRCYPQDSLGAHVLGLRDIDGIGRGGVEQSCDKLLAGTDGQRVLDRDARGVVVNIRKEIDRPPRRGHTVMLTLDAVLQLHAERELDQLMRDWRPKSACAIVMDPRNGEVLAMTSRPNFDPNVPEDVADNAWKNHCLSSIYEPGSTIKPLIVSWALQRGLIERDESLNCQWGKYQMGRRVLHDHHSYGWLSLTDILVKSSNIGMAKIGERLENKGLHQAVRRFGFGQKTGIELSGELSGLVRTLDRWDQYSTGSVPMGQEIAVTPLQMITAQAALANGGKLPQPHLLLKHYPVLARLNNEAKKETVTSNILSSVVDEDIANWLVREPMAQVVTRGTGRRVAVTDYKAFGKTGTSQKIDPDTGKYSRTKVVTSFICGAPVESPRVLVFVVADEPSTPGLHFGGTVAAPTAGKILKKALIHLRISPESNPDRLASQR